MTELEFKARWVPCRYPSPRCCAPGCGDKIKAWTPRAEDDRMVEVTFPDCELGYLEEGCIAWFEEGHPDYGGARGKLIWDD